MRKARFTEHQIITVLKSVEAGRTVKDVCREAGITGPGATATSAASVQRPSNRPRREDRICLQSWGQSSCQKRHEDKSDGGTCNL